MMKPDHANSSAKNNSSSSNKLRKGLWSPEEDDKLINYMMNKGQGCWSDVARNAGLLRCGKSCRLRWINYLRPDLKRGAFSSQEEELIVHFHSLLGNRWSQIAARLPGRTDNEIKNFWNSTIKKRLKNSSFESSPNASDSTSTDQKDVNAVALGFNIPLHEQGSAPVALGFNISLHEQGSAPFLVDPTPPTLSSSSSIQSLIPNYMIDLMSPLEQQSGYPNGSIVGGQFFGEYGDFGTETLIPPLLESILSLEEVYIKAEENSYESKVTKKFNTFNNNNNMNDIINHFDNNFSKIGNAFNPGIGFGFFLNNNNNNNQNINGEDIKFGEWDFEELMKDVSSFPFPDFQ